MERPSPDQATPQVNWSFASGKTSGDESGVAHSGERIGPYRVLGTLGQGGMGAVLRVEDPTGRVLALKLLTSKAPGAKAIERFKREGELTAALQHPHIIGIHDAGEVEGRPYLVYELVEGQDLAQAMRELPRERLLKIVHQAALGLAHAHAHGVVHRDLKPGNILLGSDGSACVADFGLAYGADLERLTRTGAMVGTPHYMAPEQLTGQREDYGPPTDVWALGVLLYRVLTGKEPFEGSSLNELMASVLRKTPPDPATLDSSVSSGFSAVCSRALSKSPAARYPDAGAFAEDLERALLGVPVLAAVAQRGHRRAAALTLTALVALCVGLASWYLARDMRSRRALEDHVRWETAVLEPLALTVLDDGQLTAPDLKDRRARLAQLKGVLPERLLAPHLELLDAHLRLLADPSAVAPVLDDPHPLQLTADAVRLHRLGELVEARRRVERALRRAPSFRPAELLRLVLLAEEGQPQELYAAARKHEDAQSLLGKNWQRLLRPQVAAAASDSAVAEPIDALSAAVVQRPEAERAAGVRESLELASAEWAAAFERAFRDRTEQPLIGRLEAILHGFAAERAGPRFSAALSAALDRSAQQERAAEIASLRLPALIALEVRLHYLCDALEPPRNYTEIMRTSYTILGSKAPPDQCLAWALASLRCVDENRVLFAAIAAKDPERVEEWLTAHPESRAGHLLLATTLERVIPQTPELLERRLIALERAVSAAGSDLRPVHEGAAWVELAAARTERLRGQGPADRGAGDPRISLAARRGLELCEGRIDLMRKAICAEREAVALVEGPQAALKGWPEAIRELERSLAQRQWQGAANVDHSLVYEAYAKTLLAAGERGAAWNATVRSFDIMGMAKDALKGRGLDTRSLFNIQFMLGVAMDLKREAEAVELLRPGIPDLLNSRAALTHRCLARLIRCLRRSGQEQAAAALLEQARARFPRSSEFQGLAEDR